MNPPTPLGAVSRTPSPFQLLLDNLWEQFSYPGSATNSVPASILFTPSYIYNQGQQPACSAHALSAGLNKTTGKIVSPEYLWATIALFNASRGIPIADGTTIDLAIDASSLGACQLSLLPNNTSLPIEQYATPTIHEPMIVDAIQQRIPRGAYKANPSFTDIQNAIATFGWAILEIDYCQTMNTMYNISSSFVLTAENCGVKIDGHFVCAIGFTPTTIICQNSFGSQWGTNGLFSIDQTFVAAHCIDIGVALQVI